MWFAYSTNFTMKNWGKAQICDRGKAFQQDSTFFFFNLAAISLAK